MILPFRKTAPPVATVAFNMRPVRGPYGGGNQWLTQMIAAMKTAGYAVRFDLRQTPDILILTHAGLSGDLAFSADDIAALRQRHPHVRCIQRINDNDARKKSEGMDALLAATNRVADHTVFVSAWLQAHHAARWFDPARPHSVIPQGADPAVFHPFGNRAPVPGEPVRVVTHHWSDNWIKGFDVYREVDDRIAAGDLPGVELHIIGRWPAEIAWKTARTAPAAVGPALADRLRHCHLYLTASRNEPGAMHPVEGAQCGLPLLYHDETGGTVELGRKFGVAFGDGGVCAAIREGIARYGELRTVLLADPPSGDRMCFEYRRLAQALIASAQAGTPPPR
jgi:glycosyltransferase involved in cell wall biosynthesis